MPLGPKTPQSQDGRPCQKEPQARVESRVTLKPAVGPGQHQRLVLTAPDLLAQLAIADKTVQLLGGLL